MDGSSQHCTGGRDQIPPKETEIEEGKVVVLQIAEERREADKGEMERYTQLNAKFQRIVRRGKLLLLLLLSRFSRVRLCVTP